MSLPSTASEPRAALAHLTPAALIEQALARGEGRLTDRGAFVALTGRHTGRSPRDRYLVVADEDEKAIDWGAINRRMETAVFDRLLARVEAHLNGRELFLVEASACADPRHRLPVR